jgi:hypothetical protein
MGTREVHETSPPQILASRRGCCRASGRLAHREGTGLSNAAGAHPRGPCRRQLARHPCTPDVQWLTERLGQPFVIENRPGAGTNVATEAVVRSAPDGYTLLAVSPANAINATLYEKLNFNFIRDIAPVASIVREPNVMVVNPSVPAKSVPEFIAYAKANPGKLSMASAGNGTASHMAGELFKMMAGVIMVHVPYRGGGPALSDLLGGQGVSGVHQNWGAARVGGDHSDPFGGVTRLADRRRFRAGLRGESDGWRRRAQEHPRRNHGHAQQGN